MPGKRAAGDALQHVSKLRSVTLDEGEHPPMAVYMSNRLAPDGQGQDWSVGQGGSGGLQISGSLVRPSEVVGQTGSSAVSVRVPLCSA